MIMKAYGALLLSIFTSIALAGCASMPAAYSPCLRKLTDTRHQQDLAISPSGNRAVIIRSATGADSELLVLDTKSGNLVAKRDPTANLRLLDDEHLLWGGGPKRPIEEWSILTGVTKTLGICDCRLDISPFGWVARVPFDDPRRLEMAKSVGAAASWTAPLSSRGRPTFSPDGKYVAIAQENWLFIFDTITGITVSANGPYVPPGNHGPPWISDRTLLVGSLKDRTRLLVLDAFSGLARDFVLIPLEGERPEDRKVIELDANADGSHLLIQSLSGNIYHVDVACLIR